MDMYENQTQEDKKAKRTARVILISIVVLIIAIIGIIFAILLLKSSGFKIIIDGKTVSNVPEDLFIIDEVNNKVYVSIKDFAVYTDTEVVTDGNNNNNTNPYAYSAHIGEYKSDVQDENKCYVENNYETASFFLNSNKICKLEKSQDSKKIDYDVYTVSEAVRKENDKMYVLSDGIEIAFNLKFYYNKESNNITITTLPYLISQYDEALKERGYTGVSTDFNNQKAILYSLFVVQTATNGEYGVLNTTSELISTKYKKIEFNENRKEFFVTNSSNKVGIFTETGATKINLNYDEMKMIDSENVLYLVKNNNKYGVINEREINVVYTEFDQIGINTADYPTNNITNQYILYEKLIPVKQNNKWGIFSISGEKILEVEYDSLGCIAGNIKDEVANNLILIPDIQAIVVCKDKKYGLINITGKELLPPATDVIYSVTNSGKDTYYTNYTIENPNAQGQDDKTITYKINVIDYLTEQKII